MATTTAIHEQFRPGTRRRNRIFSGEARWGYLLIAPMVLGFVVFFLIALLASLALSFTEWSGIAAPVWIGIGNYARLLGDPQFIEAMRNTIALTIPHVILRLTISLALALALNSKIRFRAFYRAIFFMPVLTMPVATATIWKWLYDPQYGPINAVLGRFGLPEPSWLADSNTALIAVMIVLLWSGVGYDMVIFLAGLQQVPREYYEAAEIDGASAFRRFRDITLPLLTPTTFFLLVIAIINSLQIFDLVYVMTRSGDNATFPTLVYYIYDEAFRYFRMGYAVAMGWVLLVMILIFTVIQFRLQRRWVHYS